MPETPRTPIAPLTNVWSIEPGAFSRMCAEYKSRAIQAEEDLPDIDDEIRVKRLPMLMEGGVASIKIRGPLEKRPTLFGLLFGASNLTQVETAIRTATTSDRVKSILLQIDSPGGSIDGLASVVDAVWEARQQKTVIAQSEGTIASAAYWIASQADKIFVGRHDTVGSIGVKLVLWDTSQMFADSGVKVVTVDTGDFKSAGEDGTEITEEQRAYFQGIVDSYFRDFVGEVARGRGTQRDRVMSAADGRMFLPKEAQAMGLIDGVQAVADTVAKMQEGRIRRQTRTAQAKLAILSGQTMPG